VLGSAHQKLGDAFLLVWKILETAVRIENDKDRIVIIGSIRI